MTDMTPIIQAAVALIAAIITAVLIPWIKSKTNKAQRDQIQGWVDIAVQAAEQIFKGEEKAGAKKKMAVMEFLKKNSISFDPEKIDAMIESSVYNISKEFNK